MGICVYSWCGPERCLETRIQLLCVSMTFLKAVWKDEDLRMVVYESGGLCLRLWLLSVSVGP